MKPHTKLRAGIIGIGLTLFILIRLLSAQPGFVETYYSNGLYPVIKAFVSFPAGQFQFSITEFLFIFLLFIGIPLYIRRIFKRKIKLYRIGLNILTFGVLLYVWFSFFWGINYYRLPLEQKLGLAEGTVSKPAFDSVFVDLIKQTNALNLEYRMADFSEINQTIENAYRSTFQDLGLQLTPETKTVKTLTNNWLLNKTTTSGFFSPFFMEVHINSDLFIFELPFIIAHEKAHLMGYTSEAEANFLAFLVCTRSGNALCRYSGYYAVLKYFLSVVSSEIDKYEEEIAGISDGVKHDMHTVDERWRHHRGVVSELSGKTYDLYLKSNQIKEGISNYSRVVDLVTRYATTRNK
jgi:hypothetical protein